MDRVIVVGAGMFGLPLAWRLAQDGARVLLLEATGVGGGATHASFGWLTASASGRNEASEHSYHMLKVDGIDEYRRVARELGSDSWLHLDGHVEWDLSDGGTERLAERTALLRSWGYPVEMLPARELAQIESGLTPPAGLDAFVYYGQEGYMNPTELMGLLARRGREEGVDLRTGTAVTDVVTQGGRVTGVVDASGTRHEAGQVVLCAGNAVPELLRGLGVELPMASTVGMVAVTSPSASGLRTVFHNEELSMRPDGAGRVMLRNWDFDAMVTTETPEEPLPSCTSDLLARAVKVLPELASCRIEAARIGLRPIPGDQLPVVGYVPGVEGLYAMVSHGGITHGALMGRLAAREILHGERDARLADFGPERLVKTVAAAAPSADR